MQEAAPRHGGNVSISEANLAKSLRSPFVRERTAGPGPVRE